MACCCRATIDIDSNVMDIDPGNIIIVASSPEHDFCGFGGGGGGEMDSEATSYSIVGVSGAYTYGF